MFEFTETLTIAVPDVEEQVAAFSEKEYRRDHGLIIEVAAIHEGMTANFNFYPAAALEGALQTWVSPYPKPIIMNHDPYSEPVGRVVAAKMEKEADGTPFTKLQVAITDPEAIAKVLDQRYLTGSVGGAATEANCSICGADWAEASSFNIPCKHSRGKTYKGKLAYMEMNGIKFKEYSFVNMPADQRSSIRTIATSAEEADNTDSEGWVRSARVFSLDMNNKSIVEFSESENRDVLKGMKKKEATPIYMNLKGAFLSALAIAESEDDNDEEFDLSTKPIEEEEDILAVAEGLSSDLASDEEEVAEEEATDEEKSGEEEEPAAEDKDSDEEKEEETPAEDEEKASDEEEETSDEEEKADEGDDKRPEGQEKPSGDVDPDNSDGASKSRESEEDSEEVAETEEVEEEETVEEEPVTETDLDEAKAALESRVEELEAREQALLEENTKLKAALKRQLAERVVDTKIALGQLDADDREAQLTEHTERTASSLADSLRDLATMSPVAQESRGSIPEVVETSAAVKEDGESVVTDGEDVTEGTPDPEDLFVEVLMGKRSL